MGDSSFSQRPIEEDPQKSRRFLLFPFSDGRRLFEIYPITLSIPKTRDKYYLAEVVSNGNSPKGILYYPPRKSIDWLVEIESALFIADKSNEVEKAIDLVTEVKVLRELSQSEYESLKDEIKNLVTLR